MQFTPQPDDGVTYAAKIDKAETRIDWTQAVAGRCTTTSAGCRRFPAPGSRLREAQRASRCCARPEGEGAGAPGTVLDDRLTIACGDGAVRIVELQRAGRQADDGRGIPARHADCARHGAALSCAMPRYKLIIEYDGTPFVGWQMQDNGRRCRARSTTAIEAFCGEKRDGAGRRPHRCRRACARPGRACRSREGVATPTRCATRSTRICGRIRSRCCRPRRCADDFDARFSAMQRHYLYRIVNRRADLALERGRAWRVPRRSTPRRCTTAAQRLVGQHDFTTFRSTECQAKSPVKTLDRLDVVARGRRDPHRTRRRARSCTTRCARWSARWCWSARQMERGRSRRGARARDRAACGPVAPPEGFIWCGWIIERCTSSSWRRGIHALDAKSPYARTLRALERHRRTSAKYRRDRR